MSGRLIILPKKTYTPWNPRNIERVSRDERLDRERIEREEEERRKRANIQRIQMMKDRLSNDNDDDGNDDSNIFSGNTSISNKDGCDRDSNDVIVEKEPPTTSTSTTNLKMKGNKSYDFKHVNLFEKEEKKMLHSVTHGNDQIDVYNSNTQEKHKSIGIMPVFLTDNPGRKGPPTSLKSNSNNNNYNISSRTSKNELNSQRPFYERKAYLTKNVDDKVKMRLDPMSQFTSTKRGRECNDKNETENSESISKIYESKPKSELKSESESDDVNRKYYHKDQQETNFSSKRKRNRKQRRSKNNTDADSDSSDSTCDKNSNVFEKKHKKKKRKKSQHSKDKRRIKRSSHDKKTKSKQKQKFSQLKTKQSSMEELLARKRLRDEEECERERQITQKII